MDGSASYRDLLHSGTCRSPTAIHAGFWQGGLFSEFVTTWDCRYSAIITTPNLTSSPSRKYQTALLKPLNPPLTTMTELDAKTPLDEALPHDIFAEPTTSSVILAGGALVGKINWADVETNP